MASVLAYSLNCSARPLLNQTPPRPAMPPAARRPRLRRVGAKGLRAQDLEHVRHIAALETLRLFDFRGHDLQPVSTLRHVRVLEVSVASKLESLAGIEQWHRLELLSVSNAPRLTSIDALASSPPTAMGVSRRRNVFANAPRIVGATCRRDTSRGADSVGCARCGSKPAPTRAAARASSSRFAVALFGTGVPMARRAPPERGG